MKIKIRGVEYNSVKEAATAVGVSYHSVYTALDRGRLEVLGLGKTQPKPVTLEGIEFRSMTSASTALGFNRSYLREVMRRGGPKAQERVAVAARRYAEGLTSCSATPDSRSEEQLEGLSES